MLFSLIGSLLPGSIGQREFHYPFFNFSWWGSGTILEPQSVEPKVNWKQLTLFVHSAEFIKYLFCAKIIPGAVYGTNLTFKCVKSVGRQNMYVSSYNLP